MKIINGLLVICCLFASCGQTAPPVDLRCGYLADPLSVDTSEPSFSWKLPAGIAGAKQVACQVIVASEATLLEEGKADLWDTGKTLSGTQTGVKYDGKPLNGKKIAYWKVRVWNGGDKPSAWSRTGRFGCGLTDGELAQIDNIYPMLIGVTPSELVPVVTQSLFDITENKYKGHLNRHRRNQRLRRAGRTNPVQPIRQFLPHRFGFRMVALQERHGAPVLPPRRLADKRQDGVHRHRAGTHRLRRQTQRHLRPHKSCKR